MTALAAKETWRRQAERRMDEDGGRLSLRGKANEGIFLSQWTPFGGED